jgi:hypothetical protein
MTIARTWRCGTWLVDEVYEDRIFYRVWDESELAGEFRSHPAVEAYLREVGIDPDDLQPAPVDDVWCE